MHVAICRNENVQLLDKCNTGMDSLLIKEMSLVSIHLNLADFKSNRFHIPVTSLARRPILDDKYNFLDMFSDLF